MTFQLYNSNIPRQQQDNQSIDHDNFLDYIAADTAKKNEDAKKRYEENQKRTKNMAKANALGSALTHLGDAFTQGMGGYAVERKSKVPEYLKEYQERADSWAKDKMLMDSKDLQTKINAAMFEKTQEQKNKDREQRGVFHINEMQHKKNVLAETSGHNRATEGLQDYRNKTDRIYREGMLDETRKRREQGHEEWKKEFEARYGGIVDGRDIEVPTSLGVGTVHLSEEQMKEELVHALTNPEFVKANPNFFKIDKRDDQTGNVVHSVRIQDKISHSDVVSAFKKFEYENDLNNSSKDNTDNTIAGSMVSDYSKPAAPYQKYVDQAQQEPVFTPEDAEYMNERLQFHKENPNSNAILDMTKRLSELGYSREQAREILKQALAE